MDFETGDYLINIEKLKARFYDQILSLTPNGSVNCDVEELLMGQVEIIKAIESYGQRMGE